MSYVGSVSQILSVEVAVATYVLRMFVVDEESSAYITGTITLNGVNYSIPITGYKKLDLPAGSHTIKVNIPSGWEFRHWVPAGSISVDNVNANPTSMTTTGSADMIAWIRPIPIPEIATALSISLVETPPIEPGARIHFTGKLTRIDTGAGLGGQTFVLESPPGTAITPPLETKADGTYTIDEIAPSTPGTYQYRTVFEGTSGLTRAESRTLGVGVGLEVIEPMWIVGSMLTGIILISIAKSLG